MESEEKILVGRVGGGEEMREIFLLELTVGQKLPPKLANWLTFIASYICQNVSLIDLKIEQNSKVVLSKTKFHVNTHCHSYSFNL